jgi:5-methyltetrahydrofolate corrinoid/iron sulfur protein methyltransferase
MMLEDIAPGVMSTCGLSNISNGPPVELRPILNTTYMVMLERYGMKAVISDPLDTNLTAVAKGQRSDIVDIVHQAMDGTAPDPSTIDKELGDYVKTVKVIMGETLFSDSYLDI